jgi:hypothetical protein
MKNIGKPCAGKPHARFDEGGQAKACSLLYPVFVGSVLGSGFGFSAVFPLFWLSGAELQLRIILSRWMISGSSI